MQNEDQAKLNNEFLEGQRAEIEGPQETIKFDGSLKLDGSVLSKLELLNTDERPATSPVFTEHFAPPLAMPGSTTTVQKCDLNYLASIKNQKMTVNNRLIRITSEKDDPVQRQENRVRLQHIKEQKKGPKKDVTSEIQLIDEIEDLERQLSQARLRRIRANRKAKVAAVHIIIVTNRLPIKVIKCEDGTYKFPIESISLVSGVANAFYSTVSSMRHTTTWVGWPGKFFLEHEQKQVTKELEKNNMVPVFLDKSDSKLYYHGFCQNILWHLFHSRALDAEMLKSGRKEWLAYKNVNQLFAQVALEHANEESIFWVHDYQLLLMPYYLRTEQRSAKIGFTLHIPFPTYEMYRVLPYRTMILQGVLSSDFIGFQTPVYQSHFIDACQNILKCNELQRLNTTRSLKEAVINDCDRKTTCVVVPMGINPTFWSKLNKSEETKARVKFLIESFRGQKVILGIDRLDHMKGLPNKFYALETFFESNPKWVGKVVFVQVAVPCQNPTDESNDELQAHVHKLVGEMNGRFGSVLNVPVHYLDQSLTDVSICALYTIADVCLVSSIRDGMNAVSYEFICCQDIEDPGVLILSEFTGSSKLLFDGSIKVNPWDVHEMANAILRSLEMLLWERKSLHQRAFNFVTTNTACSWAEQSIIKILEVCKKTSMGNPSIPKKLDTEACMKSYFNASRRILFLGLFGGLLQWNGANGGQGDQRFKNWGTGRFLCHGEIDGNILSALENLQSDPRTTVIVMTSHERRICERFLKSTDVWQIAENGFFLKKGASEKWVVIADCFCDPSKRNWIDDTEEIMRKYAETLENAWVQRNETAVSFFYGDCLELFGADDDDIEARIIKMKKDIREGPLKRISSGINSHINDQDVVIEQYGKQILVRQHRRKKRAVVEKCLNDVLAKVHTHEQGNPDFILCYGNFREDEDLFIRFEELNFKVNEMRAEKKMEPTIHAENEYPEIKANFQAQIQERPLPSLNEETTSCSNGAKPKNRILNYDRRYSGKVEVEFQPEDTLKPVPGTECKHQVDKTLETHQGSSKYWDSPYRGPKIAELDWSAQTEVWTVCSHRRPSQARYYLIDSRKEDLFNFLVQLDKDPTEDVTTE